MGLFNRKPSEGKKELRKYNRISRSLRVDYQIGIDIPRLDCRAKDISEGGMRLNLNQRLALGTFLKLYIYFQDAKEPVLIWGKVVGSRESPSMEYPFDTGIQFDFIDDSLRSKIQSYMQSISQE